MITSYERDDLIYILKMNRFTLKEADSAQLSFTSKINGDNFAIEILIIEDLPSVTIKRNGETKHSATTKDVDDLKIFLEERLYQYVE